MVRPVTTVVKNNELKVLQYIQEKGPVEQNRITSAIGLNLMAVNKIVNGLLNKGIIVKSGKSSGNRGRRSDLFKFNPDLKISIGIDIDENRIIFSAVHSDSKVIAEKEYLLINSRKIHQTPEHIINNIEKYFNIFVKEVSLDVEKIATIGIAPAGIVDSANGRCLLGTHLGGIVDLDLGKKLYEVFHLPIFVDDPVRSMAYFEKKHGQSQNVENFIYIYLGKGLGSGIVIKNEIYRGFRGIAGEIGHIIVNENGYHCKCGNYGCLETIASSESIIRQVKEGIEKGVFTKIVDMCDDDIGKINLNILKEAADNDDKFSLNILDYVGHYLGKAIIMLLNMFNPERILIGGEGANLSKYLIDSINRIIKKDTLNIMNEETLIQFLYYNKFQGAIGIAVEAFDMLFDYTTEEANIFINDLLKVDLK